MDPVLRRLVDESEIRQVLARYTRAIDRHDDELLRACYHPDAHDLHGDFDGGIDEFVDYIRSRQDRTTSTTHLSAIR